MENKRKMSDLHKMYKIIRGLDPPDADGMFLMKKTGTWEVGSIISK